MSYTYSPGDGLAALNAAEPADTDQVFTAAEAIRQIKAYLKDVSASVAPPTLDEVNTLIATATGTVSVAGGQNIFKAVPTTNQDIVQVGSGTVDTDLVFGTESFDPDSNFASSIFTAPIAGYYAFQALIQLIPHQAGSATSVGIDISVVTNGGQALVGSGDADASGTGQRLLLVSGILLLAANETVKVSVESTVDAANTVRILSDHSYFSGYRVR